MKTISCIETPTISHLGSLRKMKVALGSPAQYSLLLGEQSIPLNPFLGRRLQLRFTGNIHCIECGRRTQQSFQQGYCYPCFQRLAECHFCVIHPEKCLVAHAPCPENDWAHAQCNQPHIVYLANSSGLKVGITRQTNVPSRWIDQGATQALPIFQVANRYQAGVIEVGLKQFLNDKTDWRKLLKQQAPRLDLLQERDEVLVKAEPVLAALISRFNALEIIPLKLDQVTQIEYPILNYLDKASTWSLDKSPVVAGTLQGIKGQYLLFETGAINIRKFAGYEIEFWGIK